MSYLKKKLGAQIHPLPKLPLVSKMREILPDSKAIVERRMQKLGNRAITEVLVKWVGASALDNS